MAEAALYFNIDEPTFPYESLAPALSWVPAFVDLHTSKRGRNVYHARRYDTLLNVILVFSRSRTSALFANGDLGLCEEFVRRLNSTLKTMPVECGALHHQIELVQRSNTTVFVTCRYSKRFIWKRRLTHREVGLNLDFAAAGHIGPPSARTSARIVEVSGPAHVEVGYESVYLDYISDFDNIRNFVERKVSLFNSTMRRLDFPYHFELFWRDQNTSTMIAEVMESASPPSRTWWEESYFFIRELPYDMAFCSKDSRYTEYWPVLRAAYHFIITLHPSLDFPIPAEYSCNLERIFNEIRTTIQPTSSNNTPPEILAERVVEAFKKLAINNDVLRRNGQPEVYALRKSDLSCCVRFTLEILKRYTLERYKLRIPLCYRGIDRWPISRGDQMWNSYVPGGKSLWSCFRGVFFHRKGWVK